MTLKEKLKTPEGQAEAEDLLSIFMADEESRYRDARDNGVFYGVATLNRLCRFWGVGEAIPLDSVL